MGSIDSVCLRDMASNSLAVICLNRHNYLGCSIARSGSVLVILISFLLLELSNKIFNSSSLFRFWNIAA
jgi:hypothetical protein